MRSHRLSRLTKLTQGAALVSVGLGFGTACKDPPHTNASDPGKPHVNAPPTPIPPTSNAPPLPTAKSSAVPDAAQR